MFITCGFVHIFLHNNIFTVKCQGGAQADIVHVLPKKIMMKIIIIIITAIIIIIIKMMMMIIIIVT